MCPICIGTALYLLSGAGSAGGVTALTLRSIANRRSGDSLGTARRSSSGTASEVRACGKLAHHDRTDAALRIR